MTESRLKQWEQLAGQRAAGEPLSPAQVALCERLARTLPESSAEQAWYTELACALNPSQRPAPANDRLIEIALATVRSDAEAHTEAKAQNPRSAALGGANSLKHHASARRLPWVAAACLVLLGGVGLLYTFQAPHPGTPAHAALGQALPVPALPAASGAVLPLHPPATQAVPARVVLASGEVELQAARATSGQAILEGASLSTRAGSACVGLQRNITLCLAPHSELWFQALADAQRVVLKHGHLAARLSTQPDGKDFGVITPLGTLVAAGTQFAVEVPSSGGAALRVTNGSVRAEFERSHRVVHAQQALDLALAVVSTAQPAALSRDAALLDPARLWSPGAETRLALSADPVGAWAWLDGALLGQTPLSVDLVPGQHELKLQAAGYAPDQRKLILASVPLQTHVKLKPLPQAAAPARGSQ